MMNLIRCFLLAASVAQILAQNTNGTYDECQPIIKDVAEDDIRFNSTGSTSFDFAGQKDPWYLSMATFFHLARNTSEVRDLSSTGERAVFLSVPQSLTGSTRGNNTEVCYYQMDPVNATSNATDGASCNGVLSDKCQEALRRSGGPFNGICSSVDIEEDCGNPMRLWTYMFLQTLLSCLPSRCHGTDYTSLAKPFNFSSSDCSVDKLPGVTLPKGYRTFNVMSEGHSLPRQEDGFLDAYDLMVRQPLPMVLAAKIPGQNMIAVKVACMAPENITANSRIPDSEFPPNGAADLKVLTMATFAMAVACIVGVMLV